MKNPSSIVALLLSVLASVNAVLEYLGLENHETPIDPTLADLRFLGEVLHQAAFVEHESAKTSRRPDRGEGRDPPMLPMELEHRANIAKAITNYEEFVKLWKNADADLQPQVAEIKARIARLRAAESRKR